MQLLSITRIGVPARPIPWRGSVATSVTFPSRRIGRADGLDRAFLSYFIKKPSTFLEIKPAIHPSLSAKFSKKNPQILPKPTRSPLPPSQQYFPKDPLHFLKINPPSFLSQELSLKDPRILLKLCNNPFQSLLLQ